MTDSQLLRRVAHVLKRGWCRHQSAATADYDYTNPTKPDAVRFCLAGATVRAVWEVTGIDPSEDFDSPTPYKHIMELLTAEVNELTGSEYLGVTGWNDQERRSAEDVISLVENLAEKLQVKELVAV